MSTLFYILAAFGLAYVVGHSTLSLPLRNVIAGPPVPVSDGQPIGLPTTRTPDSAGLWIVSLMECPACFGFWTGVVASAFGVCPADAGFSGVLGAVLWGLFTAGSNYALARWTKLI